MIVAEGFYGNCDYDNLSLTISFQYCERESGYVFNLYSVKKIQASGKERNRAKKDITVKSGNATCKKRREKPTQ